MKFNNSNDKVKYYCNGCSNMIHSCTFGYELYYCGANVNDCSKCCLSNNRIDKLTEDK